MAENDNTGLLIVGGVVVYLVASGKLAGLLGGAVNNPNIPNGRPPPPRKVSEPLDDQIARGVGAGACVAGGIASGMPALGIAAAPVCGYVGEKIWDGAKWTGKKVAGVASGVWHELFSGPAVPVSQKTGAGFKPAGFR